MDAMRGDATLFTRDDEVEAQWRICDPILEAGPRPATSPPAVRGRLRRPRGGQRADARRPRVAGDLGADGLGRLLERAGHHARRRSRRRCASCWPSSTPRTTRYAPARVLNLVVRRRQASGAARSRTASSRWAATTRRARSCCAVEPGRDTLDARVTINVEGDPRPGEMVLVPSSVVLDVRPAPPASARQRSSTRWWCTDLATVVWSPHGHQEALDALLPARPGRADRLRERAGPRRGGRRGRASWRRTPTWSTSPGCAPRPGASGSRPPSTRPPGARSCARISSVTVRHRPDSAVAGVLFFGWLATRLGWEPGALVRQDGSLLRHARARSAQDVDAGARARRAARTRPAWPASRSRPPPGMSLSLDRGPGGLSAKRAHARRQESAWTVLGASRGEAGILGEGIRQALLRDPTYAARARRAPRRCSR